MLTCPWHGYQYELRSGRCLTDPDAELDRYAVTVTGELVYVDVPDSGPPAGLQEEAGEPALQENEFRIADLAAGQMLTLTVNGLAVWSTRTRTTPRTRPAPTPRGR